MSFAVSADAYDRFMGRFSEPLAALFAERAGMASGQRVLDVGCGPGALTAELVARLGADRVAGVDPQPVFVEANRQRHPGADLRVASAEELPFDDGTFDRTLAQLVVHFLAEPVGALRELARVTAPGGLVAACVWDHAGGSGPLAAFWAGVHDLDPHAPGEASLPGTTQGHLAELLAEAGLTVVAADELTVRVGFAGFEQWWQPYTLGVGPAGAYVAGLTDAERRRLADHLRSRLPAGAFEIAATAWYAAGRPAH